MKTTISLQTLEKEFELIRSCSYNNVPGVWQVRSRNTGPILGITINTHGNEPSGLAALSHFRRNIALKKGTVFFVLNNILATERYFGVLKMEEGEAKEAAKRGTRFCNINMNRLPENVFEIPLTENPQYEIQRAQALQPIWSLFDIGFDIHSTSQDSDPMIIACGGLHRELLQGFPIGNIVTNIEEIQIDKPTAHFYGNRTTVKTLAIETGSHENAASFECAIECMQALLINLGMVEGQIVCGSEEYDEYFIAGSVMYSDPAFTLVQNFKMFEPIREGQLLGRARVVNIVSCMDGHVLMAPKQLKPTNLYEEALFISRPVRKVMI